MADQKKRRRVGDKPSRPALIEAWISNHGAPPPKGISTRLLALSATYNAQVREAGGLPMTIQKRLSAAASVQKSEETKPSQSTTDRGPPPGTRLVREWNGRSHVVDVHDGHVAYEGYTFNSLSAVARAITGARWSGPRFFGVK